MDYDSLERLVKLRDSGALTEMEFAEQKSLLIDTVQDSDTDMPEKENLNGLRSPTISAFVVMAVLGGMVSTYFFVDGSTSLFDTRSPEESRCQSSVRASLINPETAEFFEFQPSSQSAYLSQFEEKLRGEIDEFVSASSAGSGLHGVFAQGFAVSKQGIISKNVREGVAQERLRTNQNNSSFYTYRVKANGELGNTITSSQQCSVNATSCECL